MHAPLPRVFVTSALLLAMSVLTHAQTPIYMGLGDSIGEGVQTYDANQRTQPNGYVKLIADKLGVDMPLPLIRSGPIGQVGNLTGRSRLDPYVVSYNLAVSGADLDGLIRDQSDASSPADFDSEVDLVLFPKLGSQLEIAEYFRPAFATCWIGNNDVLGAATSFDALDGSQLTSVEDFRADFREIVTRMHAAGIYTVYGNIPDVTSIAFLFGPDDLERMTGSRYGLAEGEFTSLVAMLMLRMELDDGSLLSDPNWVLDETEIALIQERVDTFNQIIAEESAAVGMPFVDINAMFRGIASDPPVVLGVPIKRMFTGGIFSLDGVHPSNLAQALVAQAFIDTVNQHLGSRFPNYTQLDLARIMLRDPFQDKDGDGRVTGRPGNGLYETIMFLVGVSGDLVDFPIRPPVAARGRAVPDWDTELFKRVWLPSRGLAGTYTDADRAFVIWLFKYAMGPGA